MNKKRDVVITVDKIHLHRILVGEKKIELRKRWTSTPIQDIWFCEKGSGGRIVGKSTVGKTEYLDVNYGWRKFCEQAGISQNTYLQYISGRDKIYYICLENIRRVEGITIEDLGIGSAPQNFTFTRI